MCVKLPYHTRGPPRRAKVCHTAYRPANHPRLLPASLPACLHMFSACQQKKFPSISSVLLCGVGLVASLAGFAAFPAELSLFSHDGSLTLQFPFHFLDTEKFHRLDRGWVLWHNCDMRNSGYFVRVGNGKFSGKYFGYYLSWFFSRPAGRLYREKKGLGSIFHLRLPKLPNKYSSKRQLFFSKQHFRFT